MGIFQKTKQATERVVIDMGIATVWVTIGSLFYAYMVIVYWSCSPEHNSKVLRFFSFVGTVAVFPLLLISEIKFQIEIAVTRHKNSRKLKNFEAVYKLLNERLDIKLNKD
jgi:hypothetical protein